MTNPNQPKDLSSPGVHFTDDGAPAYAVGLYGYTPSDLYEFRGQLWFNPRGYDDLWGPYTVAEARYICAQIVLDGQKLAADPNYDPAPLGFGLIADPSERCHLSDDDSNAFWDAVWDQNLQPLWEFDQPLPFSN